ncbi:hypothetical protein CI109_106417 [Kwoniella shandongensis]|uniref:Uncharacterized protein n=1 Tax=Kwoniella shandongensis TaxID=1734106 RepID=A0A5M6C1G1_9TREE|nr:uncharacterized protein CI109_002600 [Kwoniella shandongensis]KAA5528843.1 hypothetical protein CI109_002600 [Kwoniella shandongensis]
MRVSIASVLKRRSQAITFPSSTTLPSVRVSPSTYQPYRQFSTRQSSSSSSPSSSSSAIRSSSTPSPAPELNSTPTSSTTPSSPESSMSKSTLVTRYAPALTSLSQRTGVPLPSLMISFLTLHEITAFVPLIAVYYLFAALGLGAGLTAWIERESGEHGHGHGRTRENGGEVGERGEAEVVGGWKKVLGGWYKEGEKRVEKVGKKYGILGYDKVERTPITNTNTTTTTGAIAQEVVEESKEVAELSAVGVDITPTSSRAGVESGKGQVVPTKANGGGSTGSKAAEKVANAIAAYVVVKALLPLRIGVSIAAAPAFARYTLVPLQRLFGRWRRA